MLLKLLHDVAEGALLSLAFVLACWTVGWGSRR